MIQYSGTKEEGFRLLEWYTELTVSGDLDRLLFPSTHALGPFFNLFQSGKSTLFYEVDERGRVWFAAWFEPFLQKAAWMCLWVRQDMRHTKEGKMALEELYRAAFTVLSVIFGLTKQERLLRVHQKMGYQVVAKVPLLWGGVDDAWIMMLTEEGFNGRR